MIHFRTDPRWGVNVSNVEERQSEPPQEMQRAMVKQAEAEHEGRYQVIAEEGEFRAWLRQSDAAAILVQHPSALTLGYLQPQSEIAIENNSITIFPFLIDILKPFLDKTDERVSLPL